MPANQENAAPAGAGNIVYSAKHDGLYLYVARLLRPIWKLRCVDANLCSTLSQADCTVILDDLYAIKAFLDVNSVNELSSRFCFFSLIFVDVYLIFIFLKVPCVLIAITPP